MNGPTAGVDSSVPARSPETSEIGKNMNLQQKKGRCVCEQVYACTLADHLCVDCGNHLDPLQISRAAYTSYT